MHTDVWTIVVAAGSGQRFGAPKQFELLGDRRVVDHSLAAARRNSDGVVLVTSNDGMDLGNFDADVVVGGGSTRSESVRRGLAAVPSTAEVVLVHDAARPAAGDALFRRVIEAVRSGADAAVPAIAVTDTIRRRGGSTVDRDELVAVQTPQGFRASSLRAAHAGGIDATDDATVVEANGGVVVLVDGESTNLKITERVDLVVAAQQLGVGRGGEHEGSGVEMGLDGLRVGNGFDIHRFSDDPQRALVMGGVVFEGERALHGHSDADVVAHACADALLGAVGLGDIGSHFPDTDERGRGADSMTLLAEVVRMVAAEGKVAINIDCSVIAETPKLAPHKAQMEANLSAVIGAPVSVKGRRAEGIGGLGRREGIAAMATALLMDSDG